jgi:8-oxo-dGTP pyrophosphatase MutT (NUDIX family)
MAEDPTASRPVPVVRLIVPNAEGKVLILRRARTAYAEGSWCLPGGKVDYNETVEQAVRKELCEETALECERARFLFYQDSLPPKPGTMHCINLYFECLVSGDPQMNPESSGWAWIGPGDLDHYQIAFRNDEGLRRYWGGMVGPRQRE